MPHCIMTSAAVPGEMDDVACPGLGQRRPMEHDEHMLLIPFIELQIVRNRIKILHSQWVILPHDRYERDELADIRLQFRFCKFERFAFLNALDRDDHIFQALLSSNCDCPKQPVPGPIR